MSPEAQKPTTSIRAWHVLLVILGVIILFALGGKDLASTILKMG